MCMSMPRKGKCFANSPMESFWGSLKSELIHLQRYETHAHAEVAIQKYIEIFYNRHRRPSRLGLQSLAFLFEAFKHLQAACNG